MTVLVFDLESNGLYEESTLIHCICIQEIGLGGHILPVESFYDSDLGQPTGTLKDGLERLSGASTLIGHNIINFDFPVLEKIYGWTVPTTVRIEDTLVISRVLNPDRSGGHSLGAWGESLGHKKPEHSDWSRLTADMVFRCAEDTRINTELYRRLKDEQKGHNWKESIRLEHEVSRIITQQEINGVQFDASRAHNYIMDLNRRVDEVESELLRGLPRKIKQLGVEISKPFKRDGTLLKKIEDYTNICGPFTRITFEEMNLGSHVQVKEYLLKNGWKPTTWNYKDGIKTSPKLTEDSFASITGDMPRLIKERTLFAHRRSQIQGWIDRVREDGRITAGANTCGTNTGRFKHFGVVNVPKAKEEIIYGKEMRSLFCASPGRKFVGHDASGLEARMLAHYTDDPALTKMILESDIHTAHMVLMELDGRDEAKTLYYALIYGQSDEKLGENLGWEWLDAIRWYLDGNYAKAIFRIKRKKGTLTHVKICDNVRGYLMKRKYFDRFPKVEKLIKNVKKASSKGYLKSLDGRKVWMRRNEEGAVMKHKALNTLLQSAGAVVMKKSSAILASEVSLNNLNVLKVIDMHDEAQADVLERDVELYCELAVQSIIQAGEHYNLNIPLDAEAKVGNDWSGTH